jgi:hypothetical protein
MQDLVTGDEEALAASGDAADEGGRGRKGFSRRSLDDWLAWVLASRTKRLGGQVGTSLLPCGDGKARQAQASPIVSRAALE